MTEDKAISFISEVIEKLPKFLDKMHVAGTGFYNYSLTGDLYDKNKHWGLANSVFAVKILDSLNMIQEIPDTQKSNIINFINSFKNDSGYIYDSYLLQKSFFRRMAFAIYKQEFNLITSKAQKIAETRQAISVLKELTSNYIVNIDMCQKSIDEVIIYLNKLDWRKPWGAGSHFSHLVFFIHNSTDANKNNLLNTAFKELSTYENPDGWYQGDASARQKINGMMKVITAGKLSDRIHFNYPKEMLDFALELSADESACDNFNVIYVLKYLSEFLKNNYRYDEVKTFALKMLNKYSSYYYPEHGGFSFNYKKANDNYFGMKVSKGLDEPDIHGTLMFTWGISIIVQILGVNAQFNIREHIS